MSRRRRLTALAALVMASAVFFGAPVRADNAASLQPVFELVGPTVTPVCSGVGVVVFLATPVVLHPLGSLGSQVLRAIGPVITLCGAVPTTPTNQRYTCALDTQAQQFVGSLTDRFGTGPVVDLRPAGIPLDQIQVIADRVLPSADAAALIKQASIVLQCRQGQTQSAPSPVPLIPRPSRRSPPPPPTTLAGPLPLAPVPLAPLGPRPAAVLPAPGVPTFAPPTPALLGAPPLARARFRFSYPAVFVLPFIGLLLAAYLGRGLVTPLTAAAPGSGGHSLLQRKP